jgi:hypothetical protein
MESISSISFGIAGNCSRGSGNLNLLEKLMDRFGFGTPRVHFLTSSTRSPGQPHPRSELAR